MSAEKLREAAALMRSRAEAAPDRHWTAGPHRSRRDATVIQSGDLYLAHYVHEQSAAHIASWQPTAALAVANWLDEVARWVAMTPPNPPGGGTRTLTLPETSWAAMYPHALAVATAYLGEQP